MTQDKQTIDDLELARQVRDLPREMQPSRDLWLGIERRIHDHPQKSKRQSWNWMPYGMAASLVMAMSALVLQMTDTRPGEFAMLNTGQSLDRMQAEYVQVRNPMVAKFAERNKSLDDQTLQDLYSNLEILERARKDLEAQVRENPENRRLVELLMSVHEQELELLKQDFSSRGQFL